MGPLEAGRVGVSSTAGLHQSVAHLQHSLWRANLKELDQQAEIASPKPTIIDHQYARNILKGGLRGPMWARRCGREYVYMFRFTSRRGFLTSELTCLPKRASGLPFSEEER